MDCKFVVGQKVVAIADDWRPATLLDPPPPTSVPVKGTIYKIRRIELVWGLPMLHLNEIPGHRFHHTGFRPLQDRPKEADTDISVFTKLLDGAKAPEVVS